MANFSIGYPGSCGCGCGTGSYRCGSCDIPATLNGQFGPTDGDPGYVCSPSIPPDLSGHAFTLALDPASGLWLGTACTSYTQPHDPVDYTYKRVITFGCTAPTGSTVFLKTYLIDASLACPTTSAQLSAAIAATSSMPSGVTPHPWTDANNTNLSLTGIGYTCSPFFAQVQCSNYSLIFYPPTGNPPGCSPMLTVTA